MDHRPSPVGLKRRTKLHASFDLGQVCADLPGAALELVLVHVLLAAVRGPGVRGIEGPGPGEGRIRLVPATRSCTHQGMLQGL
jgi:hypothetical protein